MGKALTEEVRLILRPIKVLDVELSNPIQSVEDLRRYEMLQVLVRLHGTPLGYIKLPVTNGRCTASSIAQAILKKLSLAIVRHLLSDGMAVSHPAGQLDFRDLLKTSHPVYGGPLPSVTAVVCSRDRTVDLARCLDSLSRLDYPNMDLLVVDNAPESDATERLVRETYPNTRYVCEPRPGLNWARNRALLEATGEIIAYTDDDCVVDPGWLRAHALIFAENPSVMAVTGLVVPYELETEAQILFEEYGGFGRGFERKWYGMNAKGGRRVAPLHWGAGKFGTGANMAYRRTLFESIGYFDPTLDVGTPTDGGGDLEMFFRVVKEGYPLVYEPAALVRHIHRRDYNILRDQIRGWGIGFNSYVARSVLAYPEERGPFIRLALAHFWERNLRGWFTSFLKPSEPLRDLTQAELEGSLISVFRYLKARSLATKVRGTFGPQGKLNASGKAPSAKRMLKPPKGVAIRIIDLRNPVEALAGVSDYSGTRILVTRNGDLIGEVAIDNGGQSISAMRLRETITSQLKYRLLETNHRPAGFTVAETLAALRSHYLPQDDHSVPGETSLQADVSVSIVVATYDRPDELRNCLRCLTNQQSLREVEVVVVDNHPISHRTPPVMAEFPGVLLINEPRKGLSYARNAGIVSSKGEIIITTDDDVTMPTDWLEKLVSPFVRTDVMVVTGNVFPKELDTAAQQLFEAYGGLSRGFERIEANRKWFDSFGRRAVPTWRLGSTANAAFRSSIFSHPEIGLLDEALGAGTPTGCSEDTYLFYKVLKAGYTIIYEPPAYVWHEHRRDMEGLKHQIYNYSKGHVAYHLTTFIRDHDLRPMIRLVWELPRWHLWRIRQWVLGRRIYPLSLIMAEIMGHFSGPFALWKSSRRVKREGHSAPYVPAPGHFSTPRNTPAGLCESPDISGSRHPFKITCD